MKVLLTISDINVFGGAERVVVNLANALANSGIQTHILSFYKSDIALPYKIDERVVLHYKNQVCEKDFMIQKLRNPLTKIYYKNIYKFCLSAWVRQNFAVNVIIASCNMYFPFFKSKDTKYFRIEHLNFAFRYNRNMKRKLFSKPRTAYFDRLILLSPKEINLFKKVNENISVIPNFLPFTSQSCSPLTSKIVLAVGRYTEQKNFSRLIDIWELLFRTYAKDYENLKGWELHIVGDGEQKEMLEQKIQNLNSEIASSIKLFPFTRQIQEHYLNASIYTMSSKREGFPMVLLECGSAGLPCVSFNITSGPSDIIEDCKTGFLVKDGDLQTFADKLFLLISDPNLRAQMGANARKRIADNFTQQAILPKWLELLNSEKH